MYGQVLGQKFCDFFGFRPKCFKIIAFKGCMGGTLLSQPPAYALSEPHINPDYWDCADLDLAFDGRHPPSSNAVIPTLRPCHEMLRALFGIPLITHAKEVISLDRDFQSTPAPHTLARGGPIV